eukprot:scaffold71160_cov44-Attheya_sp.AAC.1
MSRLEAGGFPSETGHMVDSWYTHSQTMLPLTTVWAFTIWKSQGQTFTGKVVLNVSDHEREHGLTYAGFSRATGFSNIGLKDGITHTRLRYKILKQGKMPGRIKHERNLNQLYHERNIWMVTYYE